MRFLKRPPPPQSRSAWDVLLTLDREALIQLGLIEWGPVPDRDDAGDVLKTVVAPEQGKLVEGTLMLLPRSWKDEIPYNFSVVNIYGISIMYGNGEGLVDDHSVAESGYLSYGVLACPS